MENGGDNVIGGSYSIMEQYERMIGGGSVMIQHHCT